MSRVRTGNYEEKTLAIDKNCYRLKKIRLQKHRPSGGEIKILKTLHFKDKFLFLALQKFIFLVFHNHRRSHRKICYISENKFGPFLYTNA
jgi:hypothetical protein